jgi:hypothetical protein
MVMRHPIRLPAIQQAPRTKKQRLETLKAYEKAVDATMEFLRMTFEEPCHAGRNPLYVLSVCHGRLRMCLRQLELEIELEEPAEAAEDNGKEVGTNVPRGVYLSESGEPIFLPQRKRNLGIQINRRP